MHTQDNHVQPFLLHVDLRFCLCSAIIKSFLAWLKSRIDIDISAHILYPNIITTEKSYSTQQFSNALCNI